MKSGSWKKIAVAAGAVVFVVLAANAFYFSVPHAEVLRPENAGPNVQQIDYIQQSALVTVATAWTEHPEVELPRLLPILREHGIQRATLLFPNGRIAGTINVAAGKVVGLVGPVPPKPK